MSIAYKCAMMFVFLLSTNLSHIKTIINIVIVIFLDINVGLHHPYLT